jgi:hypothetical protein
MNMTAIINQNFRIKVHGRHEGRKLNTLVGVSGLINLVGEDFAVKFAEKALSSSDQSVTFKLRRGIKITFYSK